MLHLHKTIERFVRKRKLLVIKSKITCDLTICKSLVICHNHKWFGQITCDLPKSLVIMYSRQISSQLCNDWFGYNEYVCPKNKLKTINCICLDIKKVKMICEYKYLWEHLLVKLCPSKNPMFSKAYQFHHHLLQSHQHKRLKLKNQKTKHITK